MLEWLETPLIIKTARATIPYVQPEMKSRCPPGQFHHEPPLPDPTPFSPDKTFPHSSKMSFEQRKEMTIDCRLANIAGPLVPAFYCPYLSKSDKKNSAWNYGRQKQLSMEERRSHTKWKWRLHQIVRIKWAFVYKNFHTGSSFFTVDFLLTVWICVSLAHLWDHQGCPWDIFIYPIPIP